MRRGMRELVATGLVIGMAGCGSSSSKSEVAPRIKTPEAPQVHTETKTPVPETIKKKTAAAAISGCNLSRAERRLQSSVYSHRDTKLGKLVDEEGGDATNFVGNGETAITQSLILRCGKRVVAWVGVEPFDPEGNTINRVRVVAAKDKNAKLQVVTSEKDSDVKVEDVVVHFGISKDTFPDDPSTGNFVDKDGTPFGVAMNGAQTFFIPNDSRSKLRHLDPSTLK